MTLTFDANQPTLGTYDQSQLLDDAAIPGGTTPGGGTYNSQAYTDNAGPLGQTFSTPATKHIYALTGVSVKGVGDTGGVIGAADVHLGYSHQRGQRHESDSAEDGHRHSHRHGRRGERMVHDLVYGHGHSHVVSDQGVRVRDLHDGRILGRRRHARRRLRRRPAFNSAGNARSFANNTLGNLANHGYDRTFVDRSWPRRREGRATSTTTASPPSPTTTSFAAISRRAFAIFTDGDSTGDSYVDLNDFRQWRLAAPPEVVASIGVPEPSSAALCAATLLLPAVRRRLRRVTRGCVERPAVARTCGLVALVVLLTCLAPVARAAVTMTFTTTAPTPGTYDQANLLDDQTVPGGTTPGGGTYNSQAFSDNGGPPGQTFTTPAAASGTMPVFALSSVWLKGANTGGGNSGGGVFTTATWGVRVSSVSDPNLTPIKTITLIPTVTGALGNEWYAWTFSGADIAVLQPLTQYAFDVFSSGGYLGFDAAGDASYANGTAFNSAGPVRSFTDTTLGNLANHGYDRTFLVALSPAAINIGPGDVDLDGDTDLVDYNFIKNNFFLATGATRAQGDLTGDGRVGIEDYGLWKNNAPAAVLAALGVPEPTGLTLAALSAAAMGACADFAGGLVESEIMVSKHIVLRRSRTAIRQ